MVSVALPVKSTEFSPRTEGSFAGMEESSTKVQAASLNMFVLSLLQPSLSTDSATVLQVCAIELTSLQELKMRIRHLQDTEGVTRVVMARLEASQPVIQGKAILALAVLFQVAPDCLPLALKAGLLPHVRCFSYEACKPQYKYIPTCDLWYQTPHRSPRRKGSPGFWQMRQVHCILPLLKASHRLCKMQLRSCGRALAIIMACFRWRLLL